MTYTERFLSSLIAFISIFLRPMATAPARLPRAYCANSARWKKGKSGVCLYAELAFLDREARSIKVPKGVADHTTNKSVTRREERNG